ncbi:DUF3108 domain-containing protein [Salinisphaera aquimarina]|uniref:DUF3108 domain-containing protein n=1 Tax=Salinisphaera aquimarina TaxID=2094031 RepID=A0ABV7ELP5_9GAMM
MLGVLATGTAQADVTDTFTANFDVHRGKLALGTTAFGITPGAKAGCYVYTGQARPNALVRLFLGDVTDESRFCIEDGVIRPQHFRHHIAGDEKKSYTLDFDWSAHEVHYRSEAGKQDTMTLPERALDPLSIHMAARQWVDEADDPETLGEADFPMVDEDEIKTYRLRATDGGDIQTPAGRYDTVRVDRVDDNKRLTFWLARSAEWIPVRVEQQKDEDGIFQMNMTALER